MSSTGSRQQSCSEANGSTRRGFARGRRARPRHGRPTRPLELFLHEVLAPDALAPRLPELRLERAERDPAVPARVRPVTDQPAGEREPAAPRHGPVGEVLRGHHREPCERAVEHRHVHELASPERSRSRSAAMIPNAAMSAPPPRSAIWPADCTGGPSGSPREPEQPVQAEVVHVVPRAPGVRAVLPVAADRAVHEPRVLLTQPLVAHPEPLHHARAE